jgi:CheY-like chemotaxis protein
MTQRLPDSAVWKVRNQQRVASCLRTEQHCLGTVKYCAYNQSQGHLLGAEVDVADFSVASLHDRIPILTANSGAGLWLVPFRGISVVAEQAPLDLIYLDANSVVIDVVESFPASCISQASPPAASVLVLPSQTIRWTQTRRGDQLLLCATEEFDRRLLQLTGSSGKAGPAQSANPGKLPRTAGGSDSRVQADDCGGKMSPKKGDPPVALLSSWKSRRDVLNDPKRKETKTTTNWLQRLWSPDPPEPRQALRESFPGLSAHFWTGGISLEQGVRDISLTGLYVVTDERWFPGTQVRMTLTVSEESNVGNSITANMSVVRWGNDGVGLKFVIDKEMGLRRGQAPQAGGIDKKDLSRFLELARSSKRESETRKTHRTVTPLANGELMSNHANPVFDDLFIGPINSALLIGSLKDLPHSVSVAGALPLMNLSDTSSLPLHSVESSPPSRRRPCILLVDDDYLDIMFLADTLEEDYDVIFASEGATALESARRNRPDLILLDVMMPGIDGFEVCRRLKADSQTKEIPVIFITGLGEVAAETKGLKLGADDYISKPFHPVQLRVGVNMHISARRHEKAKSN